jgi:hypothetical protein
MQTKDISKVDQGDLPDHSAGWESPAGNFSSQKENNYDTSADDNPTNPKIDVTKSKLKRYL